jgi:hypothetical protein
MIFTNYTLKGKPIYIPTAEVKIVASGEQPPTQTAEKQEPEPIVVVPTNPVKEMMNPKPITLKPKAPPKNNIKFVI